jgi:hypothetical protein
MVVSESLFYNLEESAWFDTECLNDDNKSITQQLMISSSTRTYLGRYHPSLTFFNNTKERLWITAKKIQMQKSDRSTFPPPEHSAKAVGARLIPTPGRVCIVKIEAMGGMFERDLTRRSITSKGNKLKDM